MSTEVTDEPVARSPVRTAPTFLLARWIHLRLLGVCALAAFLSFRSQLDGLVGSSGIVPVARTLATLRAYGAEHDWSLRTRVLEVPTLVWLVPTARLDAAMHALALSGALASILLVLDVLSAVCAVWIWLAYLSITRVGASFMQFQWDSLLLECCLVAVLVAPWKRVRPGLGAHAPPRTSALWVWRLLLVKLMFLSGLVKLASGDATWRGATALDYHFWSQPLPTWTSWWAAQLPSRIRAAGTWSTLAIELVLPVLALFPRAFRHVAAAGFALLQLSIVATGNYGFFNLLTLALTFVLLDDALLARALPRTLRDRIRVAISTASSPTHGAAHWFSLTLCALVLATSAAVSWRSVARESTLPQPFATLVEASAPFDTINPYGLFASMTTSRSEIDVQGSDDGVHWQSYAFRYKPGAVDRAPPFAGLHMPRLDWQLWFASLEGHCCSWRSEWTIHFAHALLDGSPDVLALLESNPFARHPPRFVRAVLWDYRFTDLATRRRTGAWWTRTPAGEWLPAVTLRDGRVVVAGE